MIRVDAFLSEWGSALNALNVDWCNRVSMSSAQAHKYEPAGTKTEIEKT